MLQLLFLQYFSSVLKDDHGNPQNYSLEQVVNLSMNPPKKMKTMQQEVLKHWGLQEESEGLLNANGLSDKQTISRILNWYYMVYRLNCCAYSEEDERSRTSRERFDTIHKLCGYGMGSNNVPANEYWALERDQGIENAVRKIFAEDQSTTLDEEIEPTIQIFSDGRVFEFSDIKNLLFSGAMTGIDCDAYDIDPSTSTLTIKSGCLTPGEIEKIEAIIDPSLLLQVKGAQQLEGTNAAEVTGA